MLQIYRREMRTWSMKWPSVVDHWTILLQETKEHFSHRLASFKRNEKMEGETLILINI